MVEADLERAEERAEQGEKYVFFEEPNIIPSFFFYVKYCVISPATNVYCYKY